MTQQSLPFPLGSWTRFFENIPQAPRPLVASIREAEAENP